MYSLLTSSPESLHNSCDARGVKDLCWLCLSSSIKCEEGKDDLLLLERATTTIITASTPKAMPAITTPLITDDPPFFSWCLIGGVPGGGGGACPVDQEFPPVLWNLQYNVRETTLIKHPSTEEYTQYLLQAVYFL